MWVTFNNYLNKKKLKKNSRLYKGYATSMQVFCTMSPRAKYIMVLNANYIKKRVWGKDKCMFKTLGKYRQTRSRIDSNRTQHLIVKNMTILKDSRQLYLLGFSGFPYCTAILLDVFVWRWMVVFVYLKVALQWTVELSRLSPCFHFMTARTVSSRKKRLFKMNGWTNDFVHQKKIRLKKLLQMPKRTWTLQLI